MAYGWEAKMRLGKVVHVLALADNGTLVAEQALHLQKGMVVHED